MDKNNGGLDKNSPFDYLMKVIIIGDSGVGKTNILLRYSQQRFADNYLMTLGINYLYKIEEVDGVKIKVQIWDTAGQDKYKTITRNYYNGSNGVLVVYSVDCRLSFSAYYCDQVESWISDLKEKVKPECQIILLANKSDVDSQTRQVSLQEGIQLAISLEVPFFECSAKTGENIDIVFQNLVLRLKENIIDVLFPLTSTQTPKQGQGIKIGGENSKSKFKYNIPQGKKRKPCNC